MWSHGADVSLLITWCRCVLIGHIVQMCPYWSLGGDMSLLVTWCKCVPIGYVVQMCPYWSHMQMCPYWSHGADVSLLVTWWRCVPIGHVVEVFAMTFVRHTSTGVGLTWTYGDLRVYQLETAFNPLCLKYH